MARASGSTVFVGSAKGGTDAGRITRMHARVLDVLHHARDEGSRVFVGSGG